MRKSHFVEKSYNKWYGLRIIEVNKDFVETLDTSSLTNQLTLIHVQSTLLKFIFTLKVKREREREREVLMTLPKFKGNI